MKVKWYFNMFLLTDVLFLTVANWYDVMNSYTPNSTRKAKKAYGLEFLLQNEILDKFYLTISTLKIAVKLFLKSGAEPSLEIFQKSAMLSTRSLQSLFLHLKGTYSISFILTHKLNQNCLESFFSSVRLNGGANDHPSPLIAMNRIRWMLLGRNFENLSNNSNTTNETKETFITEYVLNKENIRTNEELEKDNVGDIKTNDEFEEKFVSDIILQKMNFSIDENPDKDLPDFMDSTYEEVMKNDFNSSTGTLTINKIC